MTTVTSSRLDKWSFGPAISRLWMSPAGMGLAATGLLILGFSPLLLNYFQSMLLFEHYEFVPLVLVGLPALMALRSREIPRAAWRGGFPLRALGISCAMLAVASLFCSPWAAMVAFFISTGLLLRHYAGAYWRTLIPVWLLMLLIVRPPLHLDLALITKLQIESSKVTSVVLESLGVKHLMDGNVLVIPERRFLVEEACSGINSVFALLTAAAFYAVCVRATIVRSVLLIGSAVFWACFMNLVRIAATIFAYEHLQIDIGEGTAHTISGFVTFALAVLFVAFTDQMVRFFLDPIDEAAIEFWKLHRNPFVKFWNRERPAPDLDAYDEKVGARKPVVAPLAKAATITVGVVAVCAACWQLMALSAENRTNAAPVLIANLELDGMPAQLGDWSRSGFEVQKRKKNSTLGDFSKIWTYQSPQSSALVSVDYPFRGWHALSSCYEGQGWEIHEYRSAPLPVNDDDGRRSHITEVLMHRPSGERALLLFVVMDHHGRPLPDPSIGSFGLQLAQRTVERLQRPFTLSFPELAPNSGVTTQLQMLIALDGEAISELTLEETRERFATLQAHLAGLIASSDAG